MSNNTLIVIDESEQKRLSVANATLATVSSAASKRVYLDTYLDWFQWCQQIGHDPLYLVAGAVHEFLKNPNHGKSTRQWKLSALRKMAKVLALDPNNPHARTAYESLTLLQVPIEDMPTNERTKHALNPSEVEAVLSVWDKSSRANLRNRAILAIMFFVGARRSEICALKWSDIDLDNGVILIRHGKGNKERQSAIAGDAAIDMLQDWYNAAHDGASAEREYVFCPISKQDRLLEDKAISDDTLYLMVKQTSLKSGVDFAPHDARRTLVTELLNQQMPLRDVQEQAGHAQSSTTLRYAQASDAKTRRSKMKLRYTGNIEK